MTKQWVVLMICALVAAPAWTADKKGSPKEERIGVGSGAAIGAIAGGPIGVIVGAAFGGWLGDRFHKERAQRHDAEQRYASSSDRALSLEGELRGSERELVGLRAALTAERDHFRSALEDAVEVQVYFRTAQSGLDQDVEQRLAQVAGLVREIGDFSVIVEGHADARGDAEYNSQLSAQRAAAVREVLLRSGIQSHRIMTRAAGETQSTAAERDLDALALERRVNLTIVHPGTANRVAQQ